MTAMRINLQIERWLVDRKNQFRETDRPCTTLAYAQSWDGSISTAQGKTIALSGKAARKLTHQLRSLHDGILVGIETVLSDNPQLTVRECSGNNPQPIVLDSRLRMPDYAKLHQHPDKKCWLLTLKKNQDRERAAQETENEKQLIMNIPNVNNEDFVPLKPAMKLLREKGIRSLMVEGGAKVITEFLKAGLADAIILTIAPRLIGGYQAVGDLELNHFHESPCISSMYVEKLETDLIVWGELQYGVGMQ